MEMAMNNCVLINQTSGKVDYFTPQYIIDAVYRVLGEIDLDPASSEIANKKIKAKQIYTIEDDGLDKKWFGRIFLNPPFSRIGNPLWTNKLVLEYELGNISQACCITFAATSEKWFQPLLKYPQSFLSPRTNYFLPNGQKLTGVTKGSVVTYLGDNVKAFRENFHKLGVVKI